MAAVSDGASPARAACLGFNTLGWRDVSDFRRSHVAFGKLASNIAVVPIARSQRRPHAALHSIHSGKDQTTTLVWEHPSPMSGMANC